VVRALEPSWSVRSEQLLRALAAEHHGGADAQSRGILGGAHHAADADAAADQQGGCGTGGELEAAAERAGHLQRRTDGNGGEGTGAAADDAVDQLDGAGCSGSFGCAGDGRSATVDGHWARQEDAVAAAGRHREHHELAGLRGVRDGAAGQDQPAVALPHRLVHENLGVVPDRLRAWPGLARTHRDESVQRRGIRLGKDPRLRGGRPARRVSGPALVERVNAHSAASNSSNSRILPTPAIRHRSRNPRATSTAANGRAKLAVPTCTALAPTEK